VISDFVRTMLLAIGALLPIVDPLGSALIYLGATGAAVLTRLSAFILLAIGVQIAWNGIRALVATLPHAA
jgi:small neutral amino acid transporter SnatA (MarC family)